ncbi:sigma-70 family RNA polymerase sigma factor [Clostridium sp. NSJ-6]|uniref:Sigma-70 family RNA polymerase sigma factor n=1 Tax=Clostridium hominis TaxID=2763036 RepID=A0ABR7DFT3_9CLOT|nr:sigma-70 family RNA polymerase sigma factor [Clostridium hominis]MBC5629528.1 sigma-70 family RNA polymerase sigma factor [Clostridium hominis]
MKQMEELYLNYAKTVHKYLICLTNDLNIAEDLTQETFYQASKTIKNFKGECKVSVWLCQIAKYSWYKHLEKSKKYNCDSYENVSFEIAGYQNLESDLLKNEDKMELFKKIHLLDSQSKEIIFLRISGELSFREIGDIFNKSENWARVSFYRAKQKLLEV